MVKGENKMITKTIEITLLEDDWKTLEKYGYHFSKNFEEEAILVAAQLRQEERKIKSERADN